MISSPARHGWALADTPSQPQFQPGKMHGSTMARFSRHLHIPGLGLLFLLVCSTWYSLGGDLFFFVTSVSLTSPDSGPTTRNWICLDYFCGRIIVNSDLSNTHTGTCDLRHFSARFSGDIEPIFPSQGSLNDHFEGAISQLLMCRRI